MKLRSLILGAIALGVVAATPAKADFMVIRWSSGWCQIWDNGYPGQPLAPDYKPVAIRIATLSDAVGVLNKLIADRICGR